MLSAHSAPALPGERWWRSHQRGEPLFHRPKGGWLVFPSPVRAVVKVSYILAPLLFDGRSPRPFPLSEAMQPFYTTLGTEGRRPDGCHTPLCREAAGPFGNTGKHRPADWYLSTDDSISILTEILRFAQDDGCPAGLFDPGPDHARKLPTTLTP